MKVELESVRSSPGEFGGHEWVHESGFLAGAQFSVVANGGEVLHLVVPVLRVVEASLDRAESVLFDRVLLHLTKQH